MSRRNWNKVASFAGNGLLFGSFSFLTTNIGTDPATSSFRGCGGLTGSDASTDVAVEGASFVKSITKTANNGEFLVTLQDGYRYAITAIGQLSHAAAGPADGYGVQVGEMNNEGAGHETPLSFLVTVLNASRVPAETTGRRVRVNVVLKDSGSGS